MRHLVLASLIVGLCACFGATHRDTAHPSVAPQAVWAGISIDKPIVELGSQERVTLTFALFNDGDSVVEPNIGGSTLFVNDQPWPDSALTFGNGPRDSRFDKLPPRDFVLFAFSAGDLLKAPGIYRLQWRGDGYESAVATIRVIPQHLSTS